jgi:hypothetical protein
VVANTKITWGRLLERLQQRVERRGRQHVHLVDDVDLVAALRGGVARRVAKVPDLVDAVIGRAVDLDHVEMAPVRNRDDGRVLGIKVGIGAARAVEGLGEDPRDRRLSGAPRADKEVGVPYPAPRDRIPEGAHHVVLADDVSERLRAPFARDDLVAFFGQGVVLR